MYAASIWSSATNAQTKRLQTVQNKILKRIAKLKAKTIEVQNKLQIEDLKTYIYVATKRFYEENIKHLKILDDIKMYNPNSAPFKIKYRLPYHIMMR